MASGNRKAAEEIYGAACCEEAERNGLLGNVGVARAALQLDGSNDIPNTSKGLLKASFSSVNMPKLLSGTLDKVVAFEYSQRQPTWRAISKVRSVPNFRPQQMLAPDIDSKLQPVAPTGEIKHGEIGEENFSSLRIDSFARLIRVSLVDVVNDDLQIFADLPSVLAKGAIQSQSDTVWGVFMDNDSFFATEKNYKAGADTVPSVGGLELALRMMREQVDQRGYPIDVQPKCLSCRRRLRARRSLLNSSIEPRFKLIRYLGLTYRWAWLDACRRTEIVKSNFKGNSSKSWYLVARPKMGS